MINVMSVLGKIRIRNYEDFQRWLGFDLVFDAEHLHWTMRRYAFAKARTIFGGIEGKL